MQIEICSRGIHLSGRLREHIERRVHFALERFAQRIRRVRVQVRDLNGPRGGIDKSCRVMIYLAPATTFVLEDRASSAYAAIDSLADKAAIAIVHRLKRRGGRTRTERVSANFHSKAGDRFSVGETGVKD